MTLVDRLTDVLDERERLARRAAAVWHKVRIGTARDTWPVERWHIFAWDPGEAIRHVEHARKVIKRHDVQNDWCGKCDKHITWDAELADLAEAWGVES